MPRITSQKIRRFIFGVGPEPLDDLSTVEKLEFYDGVGNPLTGLGGGDGEPGPAGPAGPMGPTGPTGPTGPAGTAGSVWGSGSGAPSSGLGVVTDWYINLTNGDIYEKTGASTWTLKGNLTGPAGSGASTMTFRTSHGFLVGGDIDTAVTVPDFYFFKGADQVSTLVKVESRLEAGTSLGVGVRRNGSVIAGTTITATTTRQSTSYSQVLSDGDVLDLIFTSPVGEPADLGLTLVIEHVVTGA